MMEVENDGKGELCIKVDGQKVLNIVEASDDSIISLFFYPGDGAVISESPKEQDDTHDLSVKRAQGVRGKMGDDVAAFGKNEMTEKTIDNMHIEQCREVLYRIFILEQTPAYAMDIAMKPLSYQIKMMSDAERRVII